MLNTRGRSGLSALFALATFAAIPGMNAQLTQVRRERDMRKPSSRSRNIYAGLALAAVGGNGRTNGAREMARRVRQMQSGKCIDPKAQSAYVDAMRADWT